MWKYKQPCLETSKQVKIQHIGQSYQIYKSKRQFLYNSNKLILGLTFFIRFLVISQFEKWSHCEFDASVFFYYFLRKSFSDIVHRLQIVLRPATFRLSSIFWESLFGGAKIQKNKQTKMIISCRLSLKIREGFIVLQQAVSNKVI